MDPLPAASKVTASEHELPAEVRESLRARLRDTCTGAEPVAAGVAVVAALAANGGQPGRAVGAALLRLADDAALEDDPRAYSLLVAVHEVARRGGLLGEGELEARFDESSYLARHPDIAAAVDAGTLRDGFTHFVHDGAREGRPPHGWRPLSRAADRALGWTWVGGDRRHPAPGEATPLALNFIGFLSSNMGLGVTARNFIRMFDDAGFDLHLVDLPVTGGRSMHDLGHGHRFAAPYEPSPHDVNLFVMNPKDVGDQLGRGFAALRTARRINVALPFWELPRLPPTWVPILDTLDLVVAASDFVRDQFAAEGNCPPIVEMGHPLYLPEGIGPDRARFGIPADRVAFLSSFDLSSDIARKNPAGALRAFERAFDGDDRAWLVVKVNSHRRPDAGDAAHLQVLLDAARRSRNVHVIHEILGYRDLMALYASCDVFVSLHRAEGLGLCAMEMMSLGKPAIVTRWSGSLSYANDDNCCLVDFDFVPVRGETQIAYDPSNLRPGAVWADARLDDAAHWMRRLVDEPQVRHAIGERARSDMVVYQRRIDVTGLVNSIRRIAARRGISLAR
ncbi:MAG TPA: glycosyltransferase [Planctomycetota bacterium]|nr:glycosyltransferase [Planctomycetota bacterium]